MCTEITGKWHWGSKSKTQKNASKTVLVFHLVLSFLSNKILRDKAVSKCSQNDQINLITLFVLHVLHVTLTQGFSAGAPQRADGHIWRHFELSHFGSRDNEVQWVEVRGAITHPARAQDSTPPFREWSSLAPKVSSAKAENPAWITEDDFYPFILTFPHKIWKPSRLRFCLFSHTV